MGKGVGVIVAVPVGVPVMVTTEAGVNVTVVVTMATCVGAMTPKLGVAVGEGGPIRLERIIAAAPTPKAKRATTAVTLTHTQVERRGFSRSSSGTMSKSSSSDKKHYAFWRIVSALWP